MKIYLVGGSIRDRLLGLPVREKDWVVVGASPDLLSAQGFKPVGRDFPVFLHPKTKEEYALARTEKKIKKGHQGFSFSTAPDITIEQDLVRRDITINAIAQADDGTIIDPFNGQKDLENRLLRHVSPAFEEDPLRVLRVARFASYLAPFNFKVAPETYDLMKKVASSDELCALSQERIWQEMHKALMTSDPDKFFSVLFQCGALSKIFPLLLENYRVEKSKCPPRVAVQRAVQDAASVEVLFATLFIPWEQYLAKEQDAIQEVQCVLLWLKAPKKFIHLLLNVLRVFKKIKHAQSAEDYMGMLEQIDAFRQKEKFNKVLLTCHYLYGEDKQGTRSIKTFERVQRACQEIRLSKEETTGKTGTEIGVYRREKYMQVIRNTLLPENRT